MKPMKQIALGVTAALLGTAGLYAADLNKAMQDTESRRKAAESGLHQIKVKSSADGQSVRTTYDQAATQNNAWLEQVSEAINRPSTSAPDVSLIADQAASAFIVWVATRNRSLGEFELAGAAAEAVKKKVVGDLTDIAIEAWKSNHHRDQGRRTAFTKSLSDRTRWKTSEQVQ